jgi:DNA repair protein RecN (Recombination protein N)
MPPPYDGCVLRRLRIENLVLIREAELELDAGLNAITGETGAGKTIFSNAVGLLLGGRGEAALIGAAADEAYVEAEFDLPDDELLGALAELRPEGEESLVVARRIFADGRTRAYAWGRSAAREDVAGAVEALLAMSGQFEQRRLARPGYQLAVLDAFAGTVENARAARRAWRELATARRAHDELTRDSAAAEARLEELRTLAADTDGLGPTDEDDLRTERERLRNVSELALGTDAALAALIDDEREAGTDLVAAAERAIAPLERLAPELAAAGEALRTAELALRDVAAELRGFLDSLEADPGRLEEVEVALDRIATLKRRYHATSYDALLERAGGARAALDALEDGHDPARAAADTLGTAQAEVDRIHADLSAARRVAAPRFAGAVSTELVGVGLGEGEFHVDVREADQGPSGSDEVSFSVRPNAGLPFGPVAETASGGELSRIALAIAAVGGGETMVFDEIDAGIGGTTAHAVGETIRRLAGRTQVLTITHLPQIATLADRHFRVEKIPGDPTHTRIEALGLDERRRELERMLGGADFLAAVQR